MSRLVHVFAALLLLALLAAPAARGQVSPISFEITGNAVYKVLPNGDIKVREELRFSASAFEAFRKVYSPLSTLVRELSPRSAPVEIRNLSISLDEARNMLTATYVLKGGAVYRGGDVWEIRVGEPGEKLTVTTLEPGRAVLVRIYGAAEGFRIVETMTYLLPSGAGKPVYDEDSGVLSYRYKPTLPEMTRTVTLTSMATRTVTVRGEAGAAAPPGLRYAGVGLVALGAAVAALGALTGRKEAPYPPGRA